ncbi:hypothetical protein N7448_007348 [Penicillium atrosanguineum]|uniref:Uncharacterized protein n=1 Tax=Penicillium atrosanguineum TaxID=1132637 RepID=A0A9W9GPH6_9EURO|nr:uncharacterized protein N7443_001624 [Penicillium atrosanguineum]KAJ5126569.1 hypothetical protein N7448_007348 [Penicillium atrosanguineum]KAJ5146769.1 hypothetical protein N7526_000121 [Penicillium atrosanguineum]KAJ5314740.1 hypothetical protein N7443_001624 [Penicillium atrosanguineum]KAJ5331910.1 hypothetical protein N7476_001693 [Penicillium atrosanguineum]
MSFATDTKEKPTDDRFERKMVTIAPSAPTQKRPIRKPTESVKTALRELQQGDLVQLLNDVQEEIITLVNSKNGVDPSSVATYFHSPSPFTFSFYHYPEPGAILLIWTQWEGAVSVRNISLQRNVLLDMIAIAEGEGIKITQMMKVQGADQIKADRLKEEAFSAK